MYFTFFSVGFWSFVLEMLRGLSVLEALALCMGILLKCCNEIYSVSVLLWC